MGLEMRVGLVLKDVPPEAGGAYTLQNTVVSALIGTHGEHEFVKVLHYNTAKKLIRRKGLLSFAMGGKGRGLEESPQPRLTGSPSHVPLSQQSLGLMVKRAFPAADDYYRDQAVLLQLDLLWFAEPGHEVVPVPFITTVWDLAHRVHPYFPEVNTTGWTWNEREAVYRSVLSRAAHVITGTEAGKSEIIKFYGLHPNNISALPFPAARFLSNNDENKLDVISKYSLKLPYVFYPAQFWPHKNHMNLLLAVKKLHRDKDFPVHLVLSGADKGNSSYIFEQIVKLGLKEHVHYLGFVSVEDMQPLYQNALALAFPTFFGPDNLPPLEAFIYGCPVAASRIEGAHEQLQDAVAWFDPASPDELADAIYEIWSNESYRQQLIGRGKAIAEERSPQAYLAKALQVLDRLEPIRRCWGAFYTHT